MTELDAVLEVLMEEFARTIAHWGDKYPSVANRAYYRYEYKSLPLSVAMGLWGCDIVYANYMVVGNLICVQ